MQGERREVRGEEQSVAEASEVGKAAHHIHMVICGNTMHLLLLLKGAGRLGGRRMGGASRL